MIFWLDWKLFGNGHGLASPRFDDKFYWLSGDFYVWSGGFGVQLISFGWLTPSPGTERQILNETFRVYSAHRRGPRVKIGWGRIPEIKTPVEFAALKEKLQNWPNGTSW